MPEDKNIQPFDRIASDLKPDNMSDLSASRQISRSKAVKYKLKDSYVKRLKKKFIPRSHSAAIFTQAHQFEGLHALLFDEEEYDDDPFYEIYDCHKMTFLESKIQHPLEKFETIEFAKEDIEDMIRHQIRDKAAANSTDDQDKRRKKYINAMKPIIETEKLVDDEELQTF